MPVGVGAESIALYIVGTNMARGMRDGWKMNNWGWVVVVVEIVVYGIILDMNTNKTPAKQRTQTMTEQKQTHDFTPNDVFTESDVKWLTENGFRDATGSGRYWEKELDGATLDVYKRANNFYVCRAADNDCYIDTDKMGYDLQDAIRNACETYRKRSEATAKAAKTLDEFVKENCK